MKFREILAIETSGGRHAASDMACQLALQNEGAVSGLLVAWMPTLILTEGWIVSPVWGDVRKHAKGELDRDLAIYQRHLKAHRPPIRKIDSELLDDGQGLAAISNRARHHDITIIGSPQTDADLRLAKAVLFASGRPVLVAPRQWQARQLGKIVVVAWKPTCEASRALAEADELLSSALRRVILQVDADDDQDGCRTAGEAVGAHLQRRGLKAESRVISPVGSSDGQAILTHAEAIGADLIVMGAYGHSRASEFVFGGVTRHLLRATSIPILMAH